MRKPGAYHMTTLAWILFVLVPVLVLIGIFGPQGAAVPSFIAAAVLALIVVGSSGTFYFPKGTGGTFQGTTTGPSLEAAQRAGEEIAPRAGSQAIEDETYDPEAWRREREQREQREREPPAGGL